MAERTKGRKDIRQKNQKVEKTKGRKDKRQKRHMAKKTKGKKDKRQKKQNAATVNCSNTVKTRTINLTKKCRNS